MALVGFQGRGCADGVQPGFCHALLLEALIFQEPYKMRCASRTTRKHKTPESNKSVDRYARHESGELLDSACLRLSLRAALSRPAQEDRHLGRLSTPEPLCRLPYQAVAQGLQRAYQQGVAKHPAHHGLAGAEGHHAGDDRPQVKQLCPTEPDEEGLVGTEESLSDAVHPRFHRRCGLTAERAKGPQSR